jgi:hypothetical protein
VQDDISKADPHLKHFGCQQPVGPKARRPTALEHQCGGACETALKWRTFPFGPCNGEGVSMLVCMS